jgi:DNA adenine methylase
MDKLIEEGAVPVRHALEPPLKWAGGKRWLVPYLRRLWAAHYHRRLVEPFCGGLSVALGLQPERALLNDINPHLINFFRWLQRGLRITISMENNARLYYQHRARFNELIRAGKDDSEEAAQLFYYLNRTGYNGLCRFNRRGGFNVPFGRYRSIPYRRDFTEYMPVLAQWEFTCGEFE